MTTSQDCATAYAARDLDQGGRRPGWVYQVTPTGPLRIDPDYQQFPTEFGACDTATIVAVVERNVVRSAAEQIELERPYLVWGDRNRPIYDQDGRMIASEEMIANGVTPEWMSYLRPYLRATDVDAAGQLTIVKRAPTDDQRWRVCLEVLPSIDAIHHIAPANGHFECVECGARFTEIAPAVKHQLGERQVELLTSIHHFPREPLEPLVAAAATRSRVRWEWLARAENSRR